MAHTMKAEKVKTCRGYEVRIPTGNGRYKYVMTYYKGKYTFCVDHTYARKFSEATADRHIKKLRRIKDMSRWQRKDIDRAEMTNEYGVRIVNRLFEAYKVLPSGNQYDKEYVWEQDVIQTNGDKFTSTMVRYKRRSAMDRAMQMYNFWMKEA